METLQLLGALREKRPFHIEFGWDKANAGLGNKNKFTAPHRYQGNSSSFGKYTV